MFGISQAWGKQEGLSAAQLPAIASLRQLTQIGVVATPLIGSQTTLITRPATMPPLQQAVVEFNKAIMRAAQYEGNIENQIRDKLERLLPTADRMVKELVVAEAVDKVAQANQVFEFNHLGNDLLTSPLLTYMAKSFVSRVLTHLATAQANDPTLTVAKSSEDAGIGFLQGWSEEDSEWAAQMNTLLNEDPGNARVLTTLAYSHLRAFRDPARLHKMGTEINKPLLNNKEAAPRLDIFHQHGLGDEPHIAVPITTQPQGWPWLKYAGWNVSAVLGKGGNNDFIGSRPSSDPHKGTGFKFQGMQEAIKPALYRRDSIVLQERPEHESGYGGFVIHDKSITTIGQEVPVSVNWRQQNMDKKLPMFSGPSSTTSFMYEVARLLDLPAAEAQPFRALLLGWMIQGRDHSFTEIMGALDAYAIEYADQGPAVVASDEKMAWQARETGDWLKAYEGLITEDINLPGVHASTITLNGQQIHLPALEPLMLSREAFDHFITDGKGYPSRYGAEEYLLQLTESVQRGHELEDSGGLVAEQVRYAPQNMDNLKLYNPVVRSLPPMPVRSEPGTPFLDEVKGAAVVDWLDHLPLAERQGLLESAASLLAESGQQDSLGHVFHYGNRNDVWETFLTVKETSMLAEGLRVDGTPADQDPFLHLLAIARRESTVLGRKQAVLKAIGGDKGAQDTLLKGMMLAVTRFYTANGANVINPGYGDFAPPRNEAETQSRLQALLKRNQYLSGAERTQARNEYGQNVELLQAALASPLFERASGTFWHGCHAAVAESLLAQREGARFPGFMSTTHDAGVAKSYMAKGALLVVKDPVGHGVRVEGISNAPGERKVLFSAGTAFRVEQSYTLHLERGYPPSHESIIKRKQFDLEVAMGKREPYGTIRVTTSEMAHAGRGNESDPQGELLLADLIAELKRGVANLEPATQVVVMSVQETPAREGATDCVTKAALLRLDLHDQFV